MFQGSIVAIITPWKDGKLDRDALAKLIDFQIEKGTSALLPCGTTGESATMTYKEHEEVIQFTVEQARNRVPVIAGTGSNSTSEALELTNRAKELGADAALLISPYYNKPTQTGIYQHYAYLAEETDFPLIMYNCPGRTGSSISPDTVARLSELPRIVGLKDATGDIDYTSEVLVQCDIPIYSGNDSMNLPIMALGGKGAVSVLANVAPQAVADLCQAALDRNWDKALALHKQYYGLCKTLFVESNPIPIKAACEMMGLCGPEIRMPMTPLTEANRSKVKNALEALEIL